MRGGRIARAGQTGRFRRHRLGRVLAGEQPLAARLARHAHEGDEIVARRAGEASGATISDRKSTRLNSIHANISYAVFCLKKKKKKKIIYIERIQNNRYSDLTQ